MKTITVSKLKIGLIGAGNIAEKHLAVIEIISDLDVIAVFSRTKKKSIRISKKYNIDKVFDNFENFINYEKIDAFLVCVSYDNIFKIINKVLETKKPFLTEKPAGLNLAQARYLAKKSKKYNSLNMVGYNRRFYSVISETLKKIVKNKKINKVIIEANERFWVYNKDKKIKNSWHYMNTIHLVDLIIFLCGDIKKINYKKNKLNNIDAYLESKKGILCNFSSYWDNPDGWSIKIYFNKGVIIYRPLETATYIDSNLKQHKIKPSSYDIKFKPGFYNQIISFKKMLIYKKNFWPSSNLQDSLKSVELLSKLKK